MPEGDTILRAARTLHRALAGRTVTRFESVVPALTRVDEDHPLAGRTIERVSAAGKHLLIAFSGDLVLRTHLRMHGSWHVYRPGEPWQRPRHEMRIVVGTADYEAVAFNVPVAEFLGAAALKRQPDLRALGPDLLAGDFDLPEALARMRAQAGATVGDALLNQRVVAGAGNVYRSEVLFLCGLHPLARVASQSDATLRQVLATARTLLRQNAADPTGSRPSGRRTTRSLNPRERLWVYGRARKPCRRCGTPIRLARVGPHARITYFCPACQASSQ
ncbi:MAG TPA: DNA-formamidopyrimidine glycosylase family protein [Vicinamibacterales bacterium]|nr:DNA-formamidopyrimidine glycosylase family protein [Vicinamibacterales bacterium]